MRRPVALLAATLLLAACGGSSDPDAQPTTLPPLTSDAPTTAPSASPIPQEAQVLDAVGAAAFARYYFELVNAAYLAGDPQGISGLALTSCRTCDNYEASAASYGDRGEKLQQDFVEVLEAVAPAVTSEQVRVDVSLQAPERTVLDRSGQIVEVLPAEPPGTLFVTLQSQDDSWRVAEIQAPSEEST